MTSERGSPRRSIACTTTSGAVYVRVAPTGCPDDAMAGRRPATRRGIRRASEVLVIWKISRHRSSRTAASVGTNGNGVTNRRNDSNVRIAAQGVLDRGNIDDAHGRCVRSSVLGERCCWRMRASLRARRSTSTTATLPSSTYRSVCTSTSPRSAMMPWPSQAGIAGRFAEPGGTVEAAPRRLLADDIATRCVRYSHLPMLAWKRTGWRARCTGHTAIFDGGTGTHRSSQTSVRYEAVDCRRVGSRRRSERHDVAREDDVCRTCLRGRLEAAQFVELRR